MKHRYLHTVMMSVKVAMSTDLHVYGPFVTVPFEFFIPSYAQ